jgi:cyclase
MGLAVRIIPILLKRGDLLVKGEKFDSTRVVGHVLQAAKIHQARGVDELCIFDVACDEPDYAAIEELTASCWMPLSVGGGVRTIEHMRGLFNAGADKVVVKATIGNVSLVRTAADRFGCQAIVVSLETEETMAPVFEEAGAGEILLQSRARDGTMGGYDLDLIRSVCDSVQIPVIAAGGCGTPQHALEAIRAGASAVGIGAMLQFSDETPATVARYLAEHGCEVRN